MGKQFNFLIVYYETTSGIGIEYRKCPLDFSRHRILLIVIISFVCYLLIMISTTCLTKRVKDSQGRVTLYTVI